ncbi:hypothetical protein EHP00_1381 [Ecytonucleospora hepatopenaei]|uniref:Uncharacterized protein n=1 Tax=Ecytonucleospora hepatopenaei TaxID=646526 RepID=A0A1W0E8U1_9MICR|nr:hypothetical protein EHP00_1381 [Ecytonucleospora hepatopenaei]
MGKFKIPANERIFTMQLYKNNIYFNSDNQICKLDSDYSIHSILQAENKIKFYKLGDYFDVVFLETKMLVMKDNEVICSMNKSITCAATYLNYILLGEKDTNKFEVWEVSKTYSFQMFRKVFSYNQFNNKIKGIERFGDIFMIWSDDNSVKEFDLGNKKIKNVWNSKALVLKSLKHEGFNIFINSKSIIYDGQIIKHGNILKADFCGDKIILLTGDNEIILYKMEVKENMYTKKETSKVLEIKVIMTISHEIPEKIYKCVLNNYLLYLKTENFFIVFDLQANAIIQQIYLGEILQCKALKIKEFGQDKQKNLLFCLSKGGKVILYDFNKYKGIIEDKDFKGGDIFVFNQVLMFVGSNGYVGMWNFEDRVLFNSFYLNCNVKSAQFSDDFLCISCGNRLQVYHNGKNIKTLTYDNIFKFRIYKGKTYTQISEQQISVYDILQDKEVFFEMENNILDFIVKERNIVLRDKTGIRVFDFLSFSETFLDVYGSNITFFDFSCDTIIYLTDDNKLFLKEKKEILKSDFQVAEFKDKKCMDITLTDFGYFLVFENEGVDVYYKEWIEKSKIQETNLNMENGYLVRALLDRY